MGQVLAVVSQKGGVGKTTTAVNLAAAFARRGLKTLLVDVDPQGAVRYGVGLRHGHSLHGISDYIAGERSLREVILPTALPWLRVILAGTVSTETSHAGYQHRIENTDLLPNLLSLARQRTHITIVDTPPGLGPVVHRVLEASKHGCRCCSTSRAFERSNPGTSWCRSSASHSRCRPPRRSFAVSRRSSR